MRRASSRTPNRANNALSTFRTVCRGVTSEPVNTCTSLTPPCRVVARRAEMTPGNVASSASASAIGNDAAGGVTGAAAPSARFGSSASPAGPGP